MIHTIEWGNNTCEFDLPSDWKRNKTPFPYIFGFNNEELLVTCSLRPEYDICVRSVSVSRFNVMPEDKDVDLVKQLFFNDVENSGIHQKKGMIAKCLTLECIN